MEDEDDFDVDAMIADIEGTAPIEAKPAAGLTCPECEILLEEVDGEFTCPQCSIQAPVLQIEETELQYDETGRAIVGMRVKIGPDRRKHEIDYGWAWSTDEAIVHILNLQLNALKRSGLICDKFCQGTKNMWTKYWLENIAPIIRDQYNELDDLVTLMTETKITKLRDIEVLIRVQDKVLIPKKRKPSAKSKPRVYNMHENRFMRPRRGLGDELNGYQEVEDAQTNAQINCDLNHNILIDDHPELNSPQANLPMDVDNDDQTGDSLKPPSRRRTTRDSLCILTLNRTLAFIEATSRCMNPAEPLFAADIIRACTNRLMPFFGVHKTLPDGMKLNYQDKLMFQKIRPPNPIQLTRASTVLLVRLYEDKLPVALPVPSFQKILERFVKDMNLPNDLVNIIRRQIDFTSISKLKNPTIIGESHRKILRWPPQYDRWAYAIFVCQMKRLFGLREHEIYEQNQLVEEESRHRTNTGQKYLSLSRWAQQMHMRLELILTHDPFVLFHPMSRTRRLQSTPQMVKYIETLINDRVITETRTCPIRQNYDEKYRDELADFLSREIPKPQQYRNRIQPDKRLDKSGDVRQPIHDAIRRTQRFWINEFTDDPELAGLIQEDFSNYKMSTLEPPDGWYLFAGQQTRRNRSSVVESWPNTMKLLLSVGGFLCYCEPHELLPEIQYIEEHMYPNLKVLRKRLRTAQSNR